MTGLVLAPHLQQPDTVYHMLVESYDGLSQQQVGTFHASLILLLCNHVGEEHVIREAITAALASTRAGRAE